MFKNIINTFFTRILASATNLIVAIIISKIYGASIKGDQSLMLTTITLVTLISAIIGSGSIVFLTPREKLKELIVPAYIWNFVICCAVFLFLRTVSIPGSEYANHICLLSFILSIGQVHMGILLGYERIKASNTLNLINTGGVLLALLVFVFIYKINTLYAYIYSLYFGYSLSLLLSCFYLIKYKKTTIQSVINRGSGYLNTSLKLFKYGLLNQLDVITQMISFRLSYYLIDYYISKGAVGIYSNAISIIESIWLISRSISTVQNARIVNSNDLNYSIRITLHLLKISYFFVFIAATIIVFLPSSFYCFIFGDEFGSMRSVIIAVSPGILFFSTSFILSGLFAGIGKYSYNTLASVVGLLVSVAMAFILIPRFGIVGAGITASISFITTSGVKIFLLTQKMKVKFGELLITKQDFIEFRKIIKQNYL